VLHTLRSCKSRVLLEMLTANRYSQPVSLGPVTIPAMPLDRAFFVKLNKDLPVLFEKFGLKVNPITDMGGGLDGIPAGFEQMMAGKISASKLVYKVADV
jgi:hypothetical protein